MTVYPYEPPERAVVTDDALTITYQRWLPPPPDYLTVSNWWAFREPCDCPDTSFGRNPHRWNCEQTPIWAQTIRDLDTNPWTVVTHSRIYCDLSFPPVGINRRDGECGGDR